MQLSQRVYPSSSRLLGGTVTVAERDRTRAGRRIPSAFHRSAHAALFAATTLAAGRAVFADALTIQGERGRSWDELVAQIESDPGIVSADVHIVAMAPDGHRVPCGFYALIPDETTRRAFRIRGCENATGATTLEFVDRGALFSHEGPVPTARRASLHGESVLGGSVDHPNSVCGALVHPSVEDPEHGGRIQFEPDRYVLRVGERDVSVEITWSEWTVRADASTAEQPVHYRILDGTAGRDLGSGTTTLRCHEPEPVANAAAPSHPSVRSEPAPRVHVVTIPLPPPSRSSNWRTGWPSARQWSIGLATTGAAIGILDVAVLMAVSGSNANVSPEVGWTMLGAAGVGAVISLLGLTVWGIDQATHRPDTSAHIRHAHAAHPRFGVTVLPGPDTRAGAFVNVTF